MESTGRITKLDTLGRISLPKKVVRDLKIERNSAMDISIEGDTIRLEKYFPQCTLCGNTENIKQFKGRNICAECIEEASAKFLEKQDRSE